MKRFLSITISVLILAFVTACGNNTQAVSESEETKVTAEEPVSATEEVDTVKESVASEASAKASEEDTEESGMEESEEEDMATPAKLLYQGHASIRITTAEGKVIYVDPFMGEGYNLPADLILMTHGHYDHTQTDLIQSKNPDCETIKWTKALEGGKHQTFDFGYVKVEAVEAGYNKNHNVKDCVGYILTFSDGVTLYLSGDTSTTPQMSELADRNLDYAFFCCDGVYNMDMNEAIECAKTVGAKHNIPYHMVPSSNSNGFDLKVAESFDVPGKMVVAAGEEIELK